MFCHLSVRPVWLNALWTHTLTLRSKLPAALGLCWNTFFPFFFKERETERENVLTSCEDEAHSLADLTRCDVALRRNSGSRHCGWEMKVIYSKHQQTCTSFVHMNTQLSSHSGKNYQQRAACVHRCTFLQQSINTCSKWGKPCVGEEGSYSTEIFNSSACRLSSHWITRIPPLTQQSNFCHQCFSQRKTCDFLA